MKIGTITFFRLNYGAVLQAYALQSVLESLGHSAVIINYGTASYRAIDMFNTWMNGKEFILNIFKILRYRQFIRRLRRFTTFETQNMNVSLTKYISSGEIERDLSEYDAFVCGSDQVWRPRKENDVDRAYFLGFVKQTQAIKASYAPSFGVFSIPEKGQQEIKSWINDITNLSVREDTGKAIIEQVTGRQASVVLDPTLLLEKSQWDRVAMPTIIDTPYILVYSTSQRGLFSELVKHVKKATGLPVVVLSLYSLNVIPTADRVIYDAGPSEFLSLFSNAACVCTNSFHGTAFSIIYRKPFWSVPHNATNSRIADLLSRLKLSNRQLSEQRMFPESPLEIDYSEPASVLHQRKGCSIEFLRNAFHCS
jgi:hypothetical protein